MSDHQPEDSSCSTSAPGAAHNVFATTHWSVVLSARAGHSPESKAALEKLCRGYWYPLYAFVRRSGHSVEDAEDLTQSFFEKLLEKGYLEAANPDKGRFRTFLLIALKRFMANEWHREHAAKRGGFTRAIPIDLSFAESKLAADDSRSVQPEIWYDRQWAFTLLDTTLKRLELEYVESGRSALFQHLRDSITGEADGVSYADIAQRLRLTEAAVKMAVHRLRARYREILRSEVVETVGSREDAEAELKHLLSVFR